jgi:hypothetical protein
MSNCEDAFQEIQRLQQQKREIEDRLNRIKVSGYTTDGETTIPDNALEGELRRQADLLDNDAFNAYIEQALEATPRVNIGGGQPINFKQLLSNYDIETAEDYAKVAQLLTISNRRLNPQDYAFITEKLGQERIAQLVLDSYRDLNLDVSRVMALMANDAAAFNSIPERMIRLRVAKEGYREAYLDKLDEISAAIRGGQVPDDLKGSAFKAWKLALVSERHYSLAGRRTGQALYARRGAIDSPGLMDTDLAEELADGRLFQPDQQEIEAGLTMTAEELVKDDHFARVVEAIDDAKVNPEKAAETVEQLKLITQLDGVDPKSRLGDKEWFNLLMRRGNALAKDSQLLNAMTQFKTNAGSNMSMMFLGPLRQAFENTALLTPYGTKTTRADLKEGFGVAWDSVKFGMDMTRASMRELSLEAFSLGKAPFGGNADTYGRQISDNAQRKAEIQQLLDMPYRTGKDSSIWSIPENIGIFRNKLQAGWRIWLESMGVENTTMGFRMMGGVDNVSGYFFHTFKIKNDLEIKARRDGAQLGLMTQRDRDEWVMGELQKAFYQQAPTEENIKSYRREYALGTDVSDQEIADRILNEKLGQTYGSPTYDTPESMAAERFSQEMRMQNRPEDGNIGSVYESLQKLRKQWFFDLAFPYVQSPFMGTLLDFRLATDWLTVPIDTMLGKSATPEQVARAKASWTVSAGLLALFGALDAAGLIVGNGPAVVAGPGAAASMKEREEWLTRLKSQGQAPNTVMGIPFLGGIPILNTLFLWKDIKETFVTGAYSKYDQYNALIGVMQVLTGHLMRQTALGQVNQLMELFLEPNKSPTRVLGYLGSGQIPGIGGIRDIERFTGLSGRNFFTSTAPSKGEQFLGAGEEPLEKIERQLRELAYGTLGLTGLIGGAYKEKDWLGSNLRLAWGQRLGDVIKDRFFPQVWPDADAKLYAELDAQNQLNPPSPLMTGNLEGVAMSDELKKEYNDTYATAVGEMSPTARLTIAGVVPKVSFALRFPVDLPDGMTVEKNKTISFPVSQFLEKHIKGKTVREALRSLINDPVYLAMEANPQTTADLKKRDMPPAERRGQAAQVLINATKRYYELIARDALNASESPAAQEWKASRGTMRSNRLQQETEGLRRFAEALNGATMTTTP